MCQRCLYLHFQEMIVLAMPSESPVNSFEVVLEVPQGTTDVFEDFWWRGWDVIKSKTWKFFWRHTAFYPLFYATKFSFKWLDEDSNGFASVLLKVKSSIIFRLVKTKKILFHNFLNIVRWVIIFLSQWIQKVPSMNA